MVDVHFVSATNTGLSVQANHFGVNAIGSKNTVDGTPNSYFEDAYNQTGATTVRFPAGEANTYFADGLMIGGQINPDAKNFLDWAQSNNISVTLVLPISEAGVEYNASDDPYAYYNANIKGDVAAFVQDVMNDYPGVVEAFEIGNEFWLRMSEQQYGEIANSVIEEIDSALGPGTGNPEILITMATPGRKKSSFSGTNNIEVANQAILDQIDTANRGKIDGVVEHYYYNQQHDHFDTKPGVETRFIQRDIDFWEANLSQDISVHITEWNVDKDNVSELGLKGASVLIEQFENMIEMGVDSAQIWALVHNTTTDVAGGNIEGGLVVDPNTGLVVTNIIGTAFDMMSKSLVGTTLLDVDFTNDGPVEVNAFESDQKIVFYVSSRYDSLQTIDFDVANLVPASVAVSAVKIGVDLSTSDGKHWLNEDLSGIPGGGQVTAPYYSEHDANALVTEYTSADLGGVRDFTISLDAYEVLEVTYKFTQTFIGSVSAEVFNGTIVADIITANGGNDTIVSQEGDDSVSGGNGNDEIQGGKGDDLLEAGNGDDSISAGEGNDTVSGGADNDTIWSGLGDDSLSGGSGADLIGANEGHDVVNAGGGNDTVWGGDGDDVVEGGNGDDSISAGTGNDTVNGEDDHDTITGGDGDDSLEGGIGRDSIEGNNGNDFIDGGGWGDTLFGNEGNDTIVGGYGNDLLTGGSGSDQFVYSSSSGNDTISDFADGEDMIFMSEVAFSELTFSSTGGGVLVEINSNSSFHLDGLSLSQISSDDFLFA